MRYLAILLTVFLLAGCSLYPNLKMPDQWKSLSGSGKAAVETVNATNQKEAIDKAADADKKVEEARKKMELEYAKFREEVQKAYEDLKKKDNDNFAKIGELNYGIYFVTQEKKKTDINTTIAHLRSKEIMNRVDKLSEDQKEALQKEVEDEKQKTIDELYIKYKANIDLAIKQKAALDAAEQLIAQKEKEKQAIRDANKQTIQKLEADKAIELESIKKAADDRVAMAQAAQKAEMLGYIIKALVAVGVVFLILAGLLKSITMGIVSISAFALAYTAATVPMWAIMTVVGVMFAIVIWTNYASHVKKAVVKQPTIQ